MRKAESGMGVCVSFVYHLTVILVALLRALTQSTRSCWSLACRKNFLIPALMTYRWQKKSIGSKRKSESTFFCHNQATIHPLNYKQIHIQRHITYKDISKCVFSPFLYQCQDTSTATDFSGSGKQLSQGTLPHTPSSIFSAWRWWPS